MYNTTYKYGKSVQIRMKSGAKRKENDFRFTHVKGEKSLTHSHETIDFSASFLHRHRRLEQASRVHSKELLFFGVFKVNLNPQRNFHETKLFIRFFIHTIFL